MLQVLGRISAFVGCADHPSLRRFENPKHPLPFRNDLTWALGSDDFLVEADPGRTVAESNKGNTIASAVFTP